METQTINLTSLICDTLNSIFSKFISSIDYTILSNIDNILFINSDITNQPKFQEIFGTNPSNGFLLIANSLIFGIVLFYILRFVTSHLIYSKIDSLYQFTFKCIIFIACMNSSLWICENLIHIISLITDSVREIGYIINGTEISFSSLISQINSSLYFPIESIDIFSFDGLLKILTSVGIFVIMLFYSIRFVLCKILILLSPFAFLSLINNSFDGFFKGWLKQFLSLLCMQIFVAIVLVLGFSFEFYTGDILSKFIYLGIIIIILKCHYHIKDLFSFLYEYSNNTLKKFI